MRSPFEAHDPDARAPWWRDLAEEDVDYIAHTYVDALCLAINTLAGDIDRLEEFQVSEYNKQGEIEEVRYQLTEAAYLYGNTETAPMLHTIAYIGITHSKKALDAVLQAKAWLAASRIILAHQFAAMTFVTDEISALPVNAPVQRLIKTIREAFHYTWLNYAHSWVVPIAPWSERNKYAFSPNWSLIHRMTNFESYALDAWVRHLTGRPLIGGLAPNLTMGTGAIFGFQQRFLSNRQESSREKLSVSVNRKQKTLVATSKLDLPIGVDKIDSEELLQRMHTTLLKHKANGPSLLKTHLYLVDQAHRRLDAEPLLSIEMDNLLKAKGMIRRKDGSFHPDTYREEWGRIATLAACWLEISHIKETNSKRLAAGYIDETPFWIVEARRKSNGGNAAAFGLRSVLLEDPKTPIVKTVFIKPGLWWKMSDIHEQNIMIPRSLLALSIDGRGHETERMAIQLASTLAIWVRASQRLHAGKKISYSVGALLEKSSIKTHHDFEKMGRVESNRLRTYLAGNLGDEQPKGAINLLSLLGAFNFEMHNEEDFWASGRGWQDRFWESKISVYIPNLGIKKGRKRDGR